MYWSRVMTIGNIWAASSEFGTYSLCEQRRFRRACASAQRMRSLARTSAARSYKQWVKRNRQTESKIPGPSQWLGMHSYNLPWRNCRTLFSSTDCIRCLVEPSSNLCLRAFRHKSMLWGCRHSLELPWWGDSNEYQQHTFLLRTDENYPSVIIRYPSYLFCWYM